MEEFKELIEKAFEAGRLYEAGELELNTKGKKTAFEVWFSETPLGEISLGGHSIDPEWETDNDVIDWQEIEKDKVIHGLVNGEVVSRIKREDEPPYIWEMTGIVGARSQYRNDLKERAEIQFKTNQND